MSHSIDDKLKGIYVVETCNCENKGYTTHHHKSDYAHMNFNYSGDYKNGKKRSCC